MNTPDTPERIRVLQWRSSSCALESVAGPALPRTGRFIKGPLPLTWMQTAAGLPGQTLAVGLALWYLAGLRKAMTVPLSNELVAPFGVTSHSKRRALLQLEQAGLIAVKRSKSKSPEVTICAAPGLPCPQKGDRGPT